MKKIIALTLALVLALSLAACGGAEETGSTGSTEGTTTAPVQENTAASAVEVLEDIWALYGEEEKFYAMGGDFNAPVDNAPGAVDLDNTDFLTYNLLVPAEQHTNVAEAASLIHGMNPNTFTCGVFAVNDSADFAAAMQTAIQGNQWMCGFPETLVISQIGGYVLVAFGVNDAMTPFQTHLAAAHPGAIELVNEAIAG